MTMDTTRKPPDWLEMKAKEKLVLSARSNPDAIRALDLNEPASCKKLDLKGVADYVELCRRAWNLENLMPDFAVVLRRAYDDMLRVNPGDFKLAHLSACGKYRQLLSHASTEANGIPHDYRPRYYDEGGFLTDTLYWDCECENDYIHPVSEQACAECEMIKEDAPPSRKEEVEDYIRIHGPIVGIVRDRDDVEGYEKIERVSQGIKTVTAFAQ